MKCGTFAPSSGLVTELSDSTLRESCVFLSGPNQSGHAEQKSDMCVNTLRFTFQFRQSASAAATAVALLFSFLSESRRHMFSDFANAHQRIYRCMPKNL